MYILYEAIITQKIVFSNTSYVFRHIIFLTKVNVPKLIPLCKPICLVLIMALVFMKKRLNERRNYG